MTIAVLGAGAFGAALAMAIARPDQPVTLWGRSVAAMADTRKIPRLPNVILPNSVQVTRDLQAACRAQIVLVAVPMQSLPALLPLLPSDLGPVVACCKGLDLQRGRGPTSVIAEFLPQATPLVLTGPSFAADIARGLPTALTLACADDATGARVQTALSGQTLRLYRTTDVTGAELGGALKNVIAIACGLCIGAGLGESARAALMTRGFAEMTRLALALGAKSETLMGLSGLGDLALTCSSDLSRNFAHGRALGQGNAPPQGKTVEGVATARAVLSVARAQGIDMPICAAVAAVLSGDVGLDGVLKDLFDRPLKKETQ